MAIYNLFGSANKEASATNTEAPKASKHSLRDRFFSSLASRLFFLFLLVVDVLWTLYSIALLPLCMLAAFLTFFKVPIFKSALISRWISLKRGFVCALALFVAILSPAFGIMIACSYFLMYDKEGMEAVVPASLQAQFKEFFIPL